MIGIKLQCLFIIFYSFIRISEANISCTKNVIKYKCVWVLIGKAFCKHNCLFQLPLIIQTNDLIYCRLRRL